MIIRNRPTKTLKASPLNSRGCVVPPECPVTWNMHTESVPHQYRWGDPVRVDVTAAILSAGPSDAAAIEGRPRCGLTGGIIADNHLILLLTFFSVSEVEDDFPGSLSLRVYSTPESDVSYFLHYGLIITDQLDGSDVLCSIWTAFF